MNKRKLENEIENQQKKQKTNLTYNDVFDIYQTANFNHDTIIYSDYFNYMKNNCGYNENIKDYINVIYKSFIAPVQIETVLNNSLKQISRYIYENYYLLGYEFTRIKIMDGIMTFNINTSYYTFRIQIINCLTHKSMLLKSMLSSNICNDLLEIYITNCINYHKNTPYIK